MAEEKLPLELILTISALEFSKIWGVPLENYEAIGVHRRTSGEEKSLGDIREVVPKNTFVVVEYAHSISQCNNHYLLIESGTALKLKRPYDQDK